jgi:hypothetical protein
MNLGQISASPECPNVNPRSRGNTHFRQRRAIIECLTTYLKITIPALAKNYLLQQRAFYECSDPNGSDRTWDMDGRQFMATAECTRPNGTKTFG